MSDDGQTVPPSIRETHSHSDYLPRGFRLSSVSLKRTKNKISEYGVYITKIVNYVVSCGVAV